MAKIIAGTADPHVRASEQAARALSVYAASKDSSLLFASETIQALRLLATDQDLRCEYLKFLGDLPFHVQQVLRSEIGVADTPGYLDSDIPGAALPVLSVDELFEDFEPPKYLVKGVMDLGDTVVLFSPPGTLKSTVANSLAFHVAMGWEFFGRPVNRAGVLMLEGEGFSGVRKRWRTMMRHHEIAQDGDRPWVSITGRPAKLFEDPDQLLETISDAEARMGQRVDLIVVDTLASNFGKGDENFKSDMTAVLNQTRQVADGRTVIYVHHTGHGDKGRERGSSALAGFVDWRYTLEVHEDSQLLSMSCLKAKDSRRPDPINFAWQEATSGLFDSDGDELTALVLVKTDKTMPLVAKSLSKIQKAALRAVRDHGSIGRSELVAHSEKFGIPGSRSGIYEAVKALIDTGELILGFDKLSIPLDKDAAAAEAQAGGSE